MLTMLQNWNGAVELNGKHFDSIQDITKDMIGDTINIKLLPKTSVNRKEVVKTDVKKQYRITVKAYMTKKASVDFDFMSKWNNDNPMPLRTMVGTIEKETRGMVYMKLHGFGEPTITCMCCGKELTNPISRHYGIGPVCMGKVGIVADIDDVEGIKEKLADVTWEGWIIKSAITEQEEV